MKISPALCTLPMVPCGSSPVTRFALACAMRKTKRLRRRLTFVQDWTPAHAARATQAWCKKRPVPNFIEKTCWPPNSPDINPVENLWSIMDEVVYKDPTPKTMKDLKKPLKQAWKKIPLSTLLDLSHSMQPRLRNVITNKAGHAGH